MSTPKYPNRDALRKALDTYLEAMYQFVSECLDQEQGKTSEELIRDTLSLPSHGDIKEIEEKDISHLIRTRWYDFFQDQFEVVERYGRTRYYDARTVTSAIVEGRNRVSHQRLNELDPEFTRVQLFFIAEILGKINRLDAQHEVDAIRDELFPDTTERLAKAEKCLETAESEKVKYEKDNAELSKQVGEKEKRLKKLSQQLKRAKTERDKHKKNLAGTKQRLEKAEAAQADYKERCETTDERLKETESELATVSGQLSDVQAEKNDIAARLAAVQDLFTTATLGKPKIQSIADRYRADTTEEQRNEIAVKVAELRINSSGSKPLSWRKIRERLGLKNDQFHKVIRHSSGYLTAVVERIKALESAEGGWEYNGKLDVLTGIPDFKKIRERVEAGE